LIKLIFLSNLAYINKYSLLIFQQVSHELRKQNYRRSEQKVGKPCIRNMRIAVYDVLSMQASGMSNEDIFVDYPELELEDIFACLAFAADQKHSN